MKQPHLWLSLVGVALITACASTPTHVTLQSIGPEPGDQAHAGDTGFLVVYSGWATSANINRHSAYVVASRDGKVNQRVKNTLDRFDEGPTRISLPVGAYEVSALATHVGHVTVPIQIEPGQTTAVYLDGYPHLNKAKNATGNLVRLPDGNIAGWSSRATE